jgi:hypothetical protein
MATPAQIDANRLNAQFSTGPRTPEGKTAAAQNRTSHGLTGAFSVLPCEDRDEYKQLLDSYLDEYCPATPTEHFFVTELAQAEWRIMRADAIEAELLNPGDDPTYAAVAEYFRDSDALARLGRYAQAARRAYYKAHEKLQSLPRQAAKPTLIEPPREAPPSGLPDNFQREFDALRRRDPEFDPTRHASQMSKELRRWFERHRAA